MIENNIIYVCFFWFSSQLPDSFQVRLVIAIFVISCCPLRAFVRIFDIALVIIYLLNLTRAC